MPPIRPATDVHAAVTVLARLPIRRSIPRADLGGAGLGGADLTEAWLGAANMTQAGIEGADLSNARGLTQEQVNSARGDRRTRLPAELIRPASWA